MRPLSVFDVDGVLADVTHRLHHLRARPQRWERFFTAADCSPRAPGGCVPRRPSTMCSTSPGDPNAPDG